MQIEGIEWQPECQKYILISDLYVTYITVILYFNISIKIKIELKFNLFLFTLYMIKPRRTQSTIKTRFMDLRWYHRYAT